MDQNALVEGKFWLANQSCQAIAKIVSRNFFVGRIKNFHKLEHENLQLAPEKRNAVDFLTF